MQSIFYRQCTEYLKSICIEFVGTTTDANDSSQSHRWNLKYSLPRLCSMCGECAFSHDNPSTWNAQLDVLRALADSIADFSLALMSTGGFTDSCNALMFKTVSRCFRTICMTMWQWYADWYSLYILVFTARSSYASAVLGVVILSVCLSIRPSVGLSVCHTRALDETTEHTADILISHERVIILVFCH